MLKINEQVYVPIEISNDHTVTDNISAITDVPP